MASAEIGNAMQFLTDGGVGFPPKPQLIPDVVVFQMPDGLGMQFRGLHAPVVVRGTLADKVLPWLMPLLDGTHDTRDILTGCPDGVHAGEVAGVLKTLFAKGVICAADEASDLKGHRALHSDDVMRRQLLFFGRQLGLTRANQTGVAVLEKLVSARIVLVADGMMGVTACDLLKRSGCADIQVLDLSEDGIVNLSLSGAREDGCLSVTTVGADRQKLGMQLLQLVPHSDLVIAALGNVPNALFDLINETCLRYERHWLRAQDDGAAIEVGPYVSPHDSPCYTCMTIREIGVVENAIEEELYQRALADGTVSARIHGESLAMATLGAAYLCTEATRVLTSVAKPMLSGAVVRFTFDGTIKQSRFTRVPKCPGCYRGTTALAGSTRDRTVG